MPHRPLRIVSYNVRYFGHALRGLAATHRSKLGIAEGIAALTPCPDVVCLQEVETSSVRSTVAARKSHPAETQLEAFMQRLTDAFVATHRECPYDAYYFRAHAYRVGRLPIYTTGLAVLVHRHRLRVLGNNTASPHPITHHGIEVLRDAKQSRICAHVRMSDSRGRSLHVFNTHLSLPTPFARGFWSVRNKMGYGVNQLHEARLLAEFVHRRAGDEAFVVTGDFNSAPASPVYQHLTRNLHWTAAQESLGQVNLDAPRAFPTAGFMKLRMHLDHLFAGGGVRWIDLDGTEPFGAPDTPFAGLSDHVPLIARFDY